MQLNMFQRYFKFLARKISENFITQKCNFGSTSSTIFALSTNIKSSGSAIAVIRISGTDTLNVIDSITNGKAYLIQDNPRKVFLQNYYDPKTKELIDHGMTLWFPKPKSYTGEDLCEFHVHGSWAVINKMLSVLGEMNGCRLAEQGEFTRRALINGKMQIIQAEAIRDLINSKTENQRRRALSGIHGNLDEKFNHWREIIIKIIAHFEAYIDFSEEELIDVKFFEESKKNIFSITEEIKNHINATKLKSDLIKDGFHIAIIGEANVGKSSLINKLTEKDVSIISPISGTTRDVVETWMDINGNCVCIADTAGIKNLNDTSDIVEKQGIKKAFQRAQECHLIILVLDAFEIFHHKKLILPSYLRNIISDKSGNELIYVVNKIDLLSDTEKNKLYEILNSNSISPHIRLSCLTDEGLPEFLELLKQHIENCVGESDQEILFSNGRHVMHLKETIRELELSSNSIEIDLAISSFHLRQASYHLSCLTGKITTEHILDVIFKDFCIGK